MWRPIGDADNCPHCQIPGEFMVVESDGMGSTREYCRRCGYRPPSVVLAELPGAPKPDVPGKRKRSPVGTRREYRKPRPCPRSCGREMPRRRGRPAAACDTCLIDDDIKRAQVRRERATW